ncbi:MAG: hypothetical protein LBL85_03295 [Methanocalculaceae archaeon]|nr:hypothetical protein [Methanocalculaceae archaeon]
MNLPVKLQVPAYVQENRSILIDVHISSIDQFYNLLDPSPEEEKDLDEETGTDCVVSLSELLSGADVKRAVKTKKPKENIYRKNRGLVNPRSF